MVKLTTKYLFRKLSKKNPLQPRKKDETDLDYLNRTTHLHLQSQFIDKIASMPECRSVSVIYLQHNLLQAINNLENFPNLTMLHLEHNYISKIENLSKLKLLRKLYLGNNEISVVEGLDELPNLTELHLESQRLPEGETLYFDPRTLRQLGKQLQVLNISNNNIGSIGSLSELVSLSKLVVDGNELKDVFDVTETLSCMPLLEEFSSEGNPVANDRKLLDHVVVASKSLKTLNGKKIDQNTRTFITNLSRNRESRRKLSVFSTRAFDSYESFSSFRKYPSAGQIECSSRIGSKLFPVMKGMAESKGLLMSVSSKGVSPEFENSLKVSRLSKPLYKTYNYY